MAKIINYKGMLAIEVTGWWPNQDQPIEERWLEVSNVVFKHLDFLEGRQVEFTGNVGLCWYRDKPYRMDCNDKGTWHQVVEQRPVKKPRKGRLAGEPYDWEWRHGEWHRMWQ